jgi:hypothetical protein
MAGPVKPPDLVAQVIRRPEAHCQKRTAKSGLIVTQVTDVSRGLA